MISSESIKKLLKKAGAKRISKNACLEARKFLEKQILLIGKLAERNAVYSGRITLRKEDIKKAIEEIEE